MHQISFQIVQRFRTERMALSANACHAVSQAPLQRSYGLPLNSINRIPGWVALWDQDAAKSLSSAIIMTLSTRKVQLTDSRVVESFSPLDMARYLCVITDIDRHTS